MKTFRFTTNIYWATAYQLFIAFILLGITRFIFYFYNADLYSVPSGDWPNLLKGGAVFDFAALCYLNLLFIIMRFLPFQFVYRKGYIRTTNIFFVLFNGFGIAANIFDTVFVRFTNTRTHMVALQDFFTDANAVGIIFAHIATFWYMVPLFATLIFALCFFAFRVQFNPLMDFAKSTKKKHILKYSTIVVAILLVILGIRGGFYKGKPLSIADAIRYTSVNGNMTLVLNTPYTLIRTIGNTKGIERMEFMPTEKATQIIGTEKNFRQSGQAFRPHNVVIIILEGIGASFFKTFDYQTIDTTGGARVMPFVDSLCSHSYVCNNAYSTGRRSIEGISAVLGGVSTFAPFIFMYSPYNGHKIDALPYLLSKKGYKSTFYCGCNKGSYSFETFARAMGYNNFVGRDEYGNDADYDGTWGIYDHGMANRILADLQSMPQPFLVSWFTLSSHEPYVLPKQYGSNYRSAKGTHEWTMEYVDESLRDFFAKAKQQTWYKNTLFVITSDHGAMAEKAMYNNTNNLYRVPFIFFTPDGSLPAFCDNSAASQIDITPSVLGYLQFDEPFVALGSNVFDKQHKRFAVYFTEGLYHIVDGRYMLNFDAHAKPNGSVVGLYDKHSDPLLTQDLLKNSKEQTEMQNKADSMAQTLLAFLQEYTTRLIDNRLTIEAPKLSSTNNKTTASKP